MVRLGIGVVLTALIGWIVFEAGNRHGSNARELAKVVKELQATNAKLQTFVAEDERIEIAEEDKATAEDQAFATELPKLAQCVLSDAQAAALNRIGGE